MTKKNTAELVALQSRRLSERLTRRLRGPAAIPGLNCTAVSRLVLAVLLATVSTAVGCGKTIAAPAVPAPEVEVASRKKTLDQKELETYWAGIKATMKGHPIEVLVAYGKHEVLEGDPIGGIVIAKFPTAKSAKDWYCSEAYQSVAKHRQKGAIYQGLIVEGVV